MNTVLASLKQMKVYNYPWPHYEIHNIFNDTICEWIKHFPFPDNETIIKRKKNWYMPHKQRLVSIIGIKQYLCEMRERYLEAKKAVWHKKTHPCEFIFDKELLAKNAPARDIISHFVDAEVISLLENLENVKLSKTFLRVMLIKDTPGYKIPVHPDTEKKLFTLQCFFKTDINEGEDLGTQLCNEHGEIIKRTIYKENAGTFFFPRQKKTETHLPTLHAFMNTTIRDYRISLMVNYCTSDEVGRDGVGNKLGYFIPVP